MNAFFYPSKRGINFAKIRGFKVTDYRFVAGRGAVAERHRESAAGRGAVAESHRESAAGLGAVAKLLQAGNRWHRG